MKRTITRQHNIKVNTSFEAESIEEQMRKVMAGAGEIETSCQPIYTDRKDGVQPQYDIRTDRFEIALDAMDKGTKSYLAEREERMKPQEQTNEETTYVTD